jgi:hypothetical protein
MNNLILCEGKTDAILLSYYLEKTCGWSHKKAPKNLNIMADEERGESAYWYCNETESLLICGVGGKDNFSNFFKEKIYPVLIDTSAFSKIAIIMDRDDREEFAIISSLNSFLNPIIKNIINDNWVHNVYENSFKQSVKINFLLIIIPTDKEGALETLLLDAISEQQYDKEIVQRSISFVENILPVADKYLHKRRLKLKACLGVTWAIQYPEKVFTFIDRQIRSVKWEESKVLDQCFKKLREI